MKNVRIGFGWYYEIPYDWVTSRVYTAAKTTYLKARNSKGIKESLIE